MAKTPIRDGESLLCIRCKIPLSLGSETEKRANGEAVIYRYYVCNACNYKLLDEKIVIKKDKEGIRILIEVNGALTTTEKTYVNRRKSPQAQQ
ncbi:MAG: hypothetical protein F7C07_03775 [Desulfurococcales archaeon]|nr:hypothetical protein [Desulfurococcales archaeon]